MFTPARLPTVHSLHPLLRYAAIIRGRTGVRPIRHKCCRRAKGGTTGHAGHGRCKRRFAHTGYIRSVRAGGSDHLRAQRTASTGEAPIPRALYPMDC